MMDEGGGFKRKKRKDRSAVGFLKMFSLQCHFVYAKKSLSRRYQMFAQNIGFMAFAHHVWYRSTDDVNTAEEFLKFQFMHGNNCFFFVFTFLQQKKKDWVDLF